MVGARGLEPLASTVSIWSRALSTIVNLRHPEPTDAGLRRFLTFYRCRPKSISIDRLVCTLVCTGPKQMGADSTCMGRHPKTRRSGQRQSNSKR